MAAAPHATGDAHKQRRSRMFHSSSDDDAGAATRRLSLIRNLDLEGGSSNAASTHGARKHHTTDSDSGDLDSVLSPTITSERLKRVSKASIFFWSSPTDTPDAVAAAAEAGAGEGGESGVGGRRRSKALFQFSGASLSGSLDARSPHTPMEEEKEEGEDDDVIGGSGFVGGTWKPALQRRANTSQSFRGHRSTESPFKGNHARESFSSEKPGLAPRQLGMPPYASFVSRLQFKHLFTASQDGVEKASGHTFTGAVLFADASGFTALTDRLSKQPNGAEELCVILNKFFSELIAIISRFGGDIVKFSGDAVTIVWPVDETEARASNGYVCGTLRAAILRACACSIELHEKLADYVAIEHADADERVLLQLHMGIGSGPLTAVHVGGVFNRWEYILAGSPLHQISIAEPLARRGQTVVSPETWALIKDVVWGSSISDQRPELGRTFESYKILNALCAQVHVPLMPIPPQITEAHATLLRRYIPHAVLPHLEMNHDGFVAELRDVSVVFVNIIGVNLASQDGGLNEAVRVGQLLMLEAQRTVYAQEGSINKCLVDDKGLLFLCGFGLPPMHHVDDAVRAVAAATNFVAGIKFLGPDVHARVGVATGRAFCGVVGSRIRREYTLMGDTVNLSVRLMAAAPADGILVDENTKKVCDALADCPFSFKRLDHDLELKGKAHKVPAFVPAMHGRQSRTPHTNTSSDQLDCCGREVQLATLTSTFESMSKSGGGMILQTGDRGSGNTFLVDRVVEQAVAVGMTVLRNRVDPSSAPQSQQASNIDRSIERLRESVVSGAVSPDRQEPSHASWLHVVEDLLARVASDLAARWAFICSALAGEATRPDLTQYLPNLVALLPDVVPPDAVLPTRVAGSPDGRASTAVTLVFERLFVAFADTQPLLIVLHVMTGTSSALLSDSESWDLVHSLGSHCCHRCTNTQLFRHPLVLMVVTREFLVKREIAAVQAVVNLAIASGLHLKLRPLDEHARSEYAAIVLMTETQCPVHLEAMPPPLLQFLSERAAGNPRHIKEVVKELLNPDDPTLHVLKSGRVELLREDLNSTKIPMRMRGAVKQCYDALPADLQLICRVGTMASAFTPRLLLDVLRGLSDLDVKRNQAHHTLSRILKELDELCLLGVFKRTTKPSVLLRHYCPADLAQDCAVTFASKLLEEEILRSTVMQWQHKVTAIIERRLKQVSDAARKITTWARRILNRRHAPERKRLFKAAYTIQNWFRGLCSKGQICRRESVGSLPDNPALNTLLFGDGGALPPQPPSTATAAATATVTAASSAAADPATANALRRGSSLPPCSPTTALLRQARLSLPSAPDALALTAQAATVPVLPSAPASALVLGPVPARRSSSRASRNNTSTPQPPGPSTLSPFAASISAALNATTADSLTSESLGAGRGAAVGSESSTGPVARARSVDNFSPASEAALAAAGRRLSLGSGEGVGLAGASSQKGGAGLSAVLGAVSFTQSLDGRHHRHQHCDFGPTAAAAAATSSQSTGEELPVVSRFITAAESLAPSSSTTASSSAVSSAQNSLTSSTTGSAANFFQHSRSLGSPAKAEGAAAHPASSPREHGTVARSPSTHHPTATVTCIASPTSVSSSPPQPSPPPLPPQSSFIFAISQQKEMFAQRGIVVISSVLRPPFRSRISLV